MSDFEVLPIGTAARLAQFEEGVERLKATNAEIFDALRKLQPELSQVYIRAEKAEAEVERLRADAERYRWLRGPLVGRGIRVIMPTPYPAILSGDDLDREIDAALKEGQR